ncbi:pentapeptide repeat-containing protein [Streptomyces sp. NBC_01231]|nr:pentapeptide repeat-containing protein [Streptomyces sp. NBC_01231]
MTLVILSLPGLAALAALLFTWIQVSQTRQELSIVEQGQITSRYNAAINNLGSSSADVRLGGIYALERLMVDSERDHPTVVSVLAAFVRQHAPARAKVDVAGIERPHADIEAVMNVLTERRLDRDQDLMLDLSKTDLSGWKPVHSVQLENANLTGSNLIKTDLNSTNLRTATLDKADLRGASLSGADLRDVSLFESNLREVEMYGVRASGAFFCYDLSAGESSPCPDMTAAVFTGADLKHAYLNGANLTKAELCGTIHGFAFDEETGEESETTEWECATLTRADLSGANLSGMRLAHINLSGAKLNGADLTGTDLSKANLTNANLTGADLSNANLTGARLTGVRHNGAKFNGAKGLPKTIR